MPAKPREAAALPIPGLVGHLLKNSPLNPLIHWRSFDAARRLHRLEKAQLEADRVAQCMNLPRSLSRLDC
jgi:hypothetical protein